MDEKKGYEHSEVTGKIIGCAMRVHSHFKSGFQESIYHKALAIEMEKAKLSYVSEYSMDIPYEGQLVGNRRVDFFVENVISVELKAVSMLEKVHLAQALNYLEAFDLEIGLLLNFGEKSLVYKRLINSKKKNHG
jgi:GxxExxY protein